MKNKQMLLYFSQSDQEPKQKNLQTQSEIKISHKNMDSLIFKDDSDQSDNPEFNQLSKTQCFHNFNAKGLEAQTNSNIQLKGLSAKITTKVLKPSLMFFQDQEEENEYEKSLKQQKKIQNSIQSSIKATTEISVQKQTVQNNNMVNERVDDDTFRSISMHRSKRRQSKGSLIQMQKKPINLKYYNVGKIQLFKERIVTLEEEKQKPIEEIVLDKDRLLRPTPQVLKISKEVIQKISDMSNVPNNRIFLLTPIPQNIRFLFEVHVYPKVFQTEYLFWMCVGDRMNLMMKAVKDCLSVKNINLQIFQSNGFQHSLMIAKMVSNFNRSEFYMFDGYENAIDRQIKILATFINGVNRNNEKNLSIYVPKMQKGEKQPKDIYKNAISDNLKELYKNGILQQHIQVFVSKKIAETLRKEVMKEFELKQSKKMLQVCDMNDRLCLFVGKKQSKRYKVVAGAGLTPLQIFALTIAHIET